MTERDALTTLDKKDAKPLTGPLGHLVMLLWLVLVTVLVPETVFLPATAVVMVLLGALYPAGMKRILRPRLLILVFLIALPAVFLSEPTWMLLDRIPISLPGAWQGLRMSLRALVILMAISGFTSSVSIPAVAGVFERAGLQGLGFTIGVALNLLPALQQSALNAWNSLRMRGGLRKRRWQGLQVLFITVITNALRRSEEIALAAEVRAFSPEKSRPMPIERGRWDIALLVMAILSLTALILI